MEATDLQARFQVKDASKMQLYSCNTPNGIKVAACLEELCIIKQSMGETFDYEAHTVDLRHAETRRWTGLFPTGKIPVLLDPEVKTGSGSAVEVFESGSILLYLAEKYGELLPKGPEFSVARLTALNWLFWGSSTFSTACKSFGFYHQFCHENLPYCRHRYTNEVLRLFGVLEQQLMHGRHWIVGDMYTIADISIWPWMQALHQDYGDVMKHSFNDMKAFPLVCEWFARCNGRAANRKSLEVCPPLA